MMEEEKSMYEKREAALILKKKDLQEELQRINDRESNKII